MAITQKTLQAIKAAPLSTVVEATGGLLKKVGHEFVTQCLWHEDTNPSLTISDQKGFCFCHVCRGGGDVLDYVQKRKGLNLRDAAELVASVHGIAFETDDEDSEHARARRAAFAQNLAKIGSIQETFRSNWTDPRASRVHEIWLARGLTKEASKEFEIGYAPNGEFAGRITIPIYDYKNRLVGWTGRATKEGQSAKYKNSADSDIFHKKLLVFNEPRGLEAAREAGCLIFVEGHLDVLSMWQAGIRNVVAMQGTGAPDVSVLKRLSRSVKNFVLCFDGDAGGRKAAEQFLSVGGPMAMSGEININISTLPEKKDPDDILKEGGDLYSLIASAPSWLDWVIDTWAVDLDKENTSMVTEVEKRLRQLINGLHSKALRTHYIDKASRILSINEKEAEKISKEWGSAEYRQQVKAWEPRAPHEIRLAAERRLLRIFIHCEDQRVRLAPLVEQITNPALRWLWERLKELDNCSSIDLTPHSAMAVVAVAEPHYMQQLRALIRPNVFVDTSEGVIEHLNDILEREALIKERNESDTD
jgi:DNA primase